MWNQAFIVVIIAGELDLIRMNHDRFSIMLLNIWSSTQFGLHFKKTSEYLAYHDRFSIMLLNILEQQTIWIAFQKIL
jgi:hypothetical protein